MTVLAPITLASDLKKSDKKATRSDYLPQGATKVAVSATMAVKAKFGTRLHR